jgi:hypothetical protein
VELVDLVSSVDAEVDDDPWNQVRWDAAPPPGERRAVEVGIEL